MSDANVVPLHPLVDADALAWLRAQPDGRVETSVSDLARQFGWSRSKLHRRLTSWVAAGSITRRPGRKGKVVIALARPRPAPAAVAEFRPAAEPGVEVHLPAILPATASTGHAENAAAAGDRTPVFRNSGRHVVALAASVVLFATAIALAAVGLTMNARFAASFGQTTEAAILLAAIGLSIDVLAVVLPTVAAQLWHHRARPAAVMAWTIWLVALTMTLLAATGFASTHIGDAVASRAKIAGENSALAQRIERLRHERTGIAEARAVAAIEAELQRAQPGAQAVWKATAGCHDVTLAASGRSCAPILQLREDLAAAQRRDAIDAELGEAEARLAVLPSIATADPQTAMAAEMIAWLSAGTVAPAPRDIYRLRTVGLTITPSLAGLVAMLALVLAQSSRLHQADRRMGRAI